MKKTFFYRLPYPMHYLFGTYTRSLACSIGLACAFAVLQSPLYAQTRGQRGEIEDAEIIVEKNREITLPEASRNFEKITAPAKQPDPVVQKYQFSEQAPQLGDLNTRFRVLQMPQDPPRILTGNYLKAGVGNYAAMYLDGFFGATQNSNYSYGGRFKHLGFGRGPVDGNNSATNDTHLSVFGRYFTDALTAGGSLEYDRQRYHFYGYAPQAKVDDRRDIRQVFNTFALKTNFTNNNSKSPLDYRLDVNVFNLSDAYDANEFEIGGQFKGSYQVMDNVKALLNTDLFLTRRKDSASISRNLFRLRPGVQYQAGPLSITGALNVVYENDTVATDNNLHLYPVVLAEFTILENFTVFGGIEGDMQRTTLRQFVHENPFLAPNVPLFHTNKSRSIYGGIRGKLSQDVAFSVRLSYAGYKNLYFYVNSLQDTTKFTVAYEPGFTNVLGFSGELHFNHNDKFRLNLKTEYNYFGLNNLEEPWHRPRFTTTVIGSYNVNNKLFFNTELYYLAGIRGQDPRNKVVELDPIVDLNLKAEYVLFDKFSAFLSLNNLLSQKYQRYLYYPSRGLNVLVGATYTF